MEEYKIHALSKMKYITKTDLLRNPVTNIRRRRPFACVKIYKDEKGELFATAYGVASGCGFSSGWNVLPFTQAMSNVHDNLYENANDGSFVIKVDDVATIVEEIITNPDSPSSKLPAAMYIEKALQFLKWWNNTAIGLIQKHAQQIAPTPTKTSEVAADKAEEDSKASKFTTSSEALINQLKSMADHDAKTIIIAFSLIAFRVNQMHSAGLSLDAAVKTAFNMTENEHKGEHVKTVLGYVAGLISVFNPTLKGLPDYE